MNYSMCAEKIINSIKKIRTSRERKKISRILQNDKLDPEYINERIEQAKILDEEYNNFNLNLGFQDYEDGYLYNINNQNYDNQDYYNQNYDYSDDDVCGYDEHLKNYNLEDYLRIIDDEYFDTQLSNKKIYSFKNKTSSKNKKYIVVDETYEDYLDSLIIRDSNINYYLKEKWIYNVIDDIKTENIVMYRDNLFCIVIDKKWIKSDFNLVDLNNAHLLLIPLDKTLRTIRSLNFTHIPLLTYMKEVGTNIISKYFEIPSNQLYLYFHYKPSIYHLHIHVTNINTKKHRHSNINTHGLDEVMYNLSIKFDYYQKTTIKVKKYE